MKGKKEEKIKGERKALSRKNFAISFISSEQVFHFNRANKKTIF